MAGEIIQTQEEMYREAEEICKKTLSESKIARAQELLTALGDYKDSRKYLAQCEKFMAFRVGNHVNFGSWNGKDISWTVLDLDGYNRLLLADRVIEYLPFNKERENTDWSKCSLRRWLNSEFLNKAFALKERMNIMLTPVKSYSDLRWADGNGPDTRDKIFVFGTNELEQYLPTPESRAIGEWWWLRGHGDSLLSEKAVYDDGTIYDMGVGVNFDTVGVRPAMWLRVMTNSLSYI